MGFKVVDCDNVRETFTGAASTTITLGGAAQNSRALSAVLTSGDTFWGTARGGAEISVGLFTYNGSTVAQTSVFYSSNSNNAVSFSSGAPCEIFIDVPGRIFDELNLTEISVASASTCDIGAAHGGKIAITGTTTITSFGTSANKRRFVRFTGALTLTHNGTSLILPGAANITTVAGDCAVFMSDGSGNWRCYAYQGANGYNKPPTSDGLALGSTSLMWSDLFLASGAVINFNNGDVTLTHSADLLTVGGGDFKITNTTAASSTITGALVVGGGVGIGGKLYLGGSIYLSADSYFAGTAVTPGLGNTNTGAFLESGTGALFLSRSSGGYVLYINENADAGVVSFSRSGNSVGSITVTSSATAYNTSSDETIKMMFDEDGIDWWDRIRRLWVGAYQMKNDPGQWRLGIRAQQAHGIVPQGVTRPKKDGDLWQADYSIACGPLAMWGVKSLDTRVTANENDIAVIKRHLGLAA